MKNEEVDEKAPSPFDDIPYNIKTSGNGVLDPDDSPRSSDAGFGK